MNETPFPPNVYGDAVPWEIPVQLCLSDVLQQGDCALDVGANIGGVSIALSRLVGPSGAVHAFEANPFTVPRLIADLAANGVRNVTVVPKAAWSRSDETISFYCDDSYYAVGSGFLRHGESWTEVKATTISLDDYCRDNGLAPKAIKLDVEGAEFEVLRGASQVLDRYEPSLVIEYYPAASPDNDALELLRSRDYACYDTNLYHEVSRQFYLTKFLKPPQVNVLALSRSSTARASYDQAKIVTEADVQCSTGAAKSAQLPVPRAGRYLVSAKLDGPDDALAALMVVDTSGNRLAYVQTHVAHLRTHTCSNLIFQVDRPLELLCTISSPEGGPVSLKQVKVNRIDFARAA